jgi:hypothetical protein
VCFPLQCVDLNSYTLKSSDLPGTFVPEAAEEWVKMVGAVG